MSLHHLVSLSFFWFHFHLIRHALLFTLTEWNHVHFLYRHAPCSDVPVSDGYIVSSGTSGHCVHVLWGHAVALTLVGQCVEMHLCPSSVVTAVVLGVKPLSQEAVTWASPSGWGLLWGRPWSVSLG